MASANEDASPSGAKVAAIVTFYMVAALVMVFVNKAVLNSTPELPLTFLFVQLAIAVVLLHAAGFLAPQRVKLPAINMRNATKMFPVSAIGVGGLVFNTLCLAHVDASYFQVARGLLLPFTIIVSAVYTKRAPSPIVLASATIVTAGFFMGVPPSAYSLTLAPGSALLPFFYGSVSSALLAVHAVLVKKASQAGVTAVAYYGNLLAAALLIPGIMARGEVASLLRIWSTGGNEWTVLAVGSCVTSVFGFALCMATLLSIRVTSPVTHMFSSAARSVIQTALGILIFGDIISPTRGLSITVITLGTLGFTWTQSTAKRGPPPSSVQDPEKFARSEKA